MFRTWFAEALHDGGRFDVIGLSVYPERNDWQQASDSCIANMKNLAATYGKPVVISEIGFYATEPKIPRELLVKMIKGCESVSGGKGFGLFYWEPESYTQHYNRSAWRPDGRPTSAMEAFSTP